MEHKEDFNFFILNQDTIGRNNDAKEFRDLKKQYQVLEKKMNAAVHEVMLDANYISGRQVTELEKALADYVGVKHCVTCAN